MARTAIKRSSFRDKVAKNSQQQRSKASNYGHLALPRGINVFKEEEGSRVTLDFLPYVVTDAAHPDRDDETEVAVVGSMWYRRPYKLHRNVGSEKNSVVCPTSIGKKCPICEYRANLLTEGAKWDDESVKALRPSDRNLYYVVPKDVKKFEEKAHVWDISQFLFQAKLNDELEENEEFCDFPDLEKGLTLKIRFSEEKIGSNTFADTSRIDFEARDYAYTEDQIVKLPSLDDVLTIKTYAEVEAAFLEVENDDSDGGAAAEEAEVRHVARARKPEPADDEDEPDEPDEPEEVTPKAVARRTPAPVAATVEKVTPIRRNAPAPAASASAEDPRRAARRAEREGAGAKERCPHGHKFGKDTDKFDECEECELWSDCMDQLEANEKAAAE